MILFQPVYEYNRDVNGKILRMKYASAIVYGTEERAKERAFDTRGIFLDDDDTLINITIRQLVLV